MCFCSAGDATAAWAQLCNSSLLLEVIDVSSNLQLNGEQAVSAVAAATTAGTAAALGGPPQQQKWQQCLVDADKTTCQQLQQVPA